MKRWIVGIAALLLLLGTGDGVHAALYGPGPDWVNTVSEGTDLFPSVGVITAEFLVGPMAGQTQTATLTGPTEVWWGDAVGDHIDTEIFSMDLTGGGMTLRAGDSVGNGLYDGPLHSPGGIDEQAGDNTLAGSFFDVFFEIDVLGMTLYNKEAHKMEAVIAYLPPINFTYILPPNAPPTLLYEKGGDPALAVAKLLTVEHTPTPEPASLIVWSLLAALGITVGWWRRRKRV